LWDHPEPERPTFHDNPDTQILLLAYTNRAVDEICKSISSIAPKIDYIRVGSELSCEERFRPHLIENVLSTCNRRSEVCERISRCRVIVGTVASVSTKPDLFRLKRFDVAIVDEATQILEPQLLGILCAKDRTGQNAIGKFILIGDHKQLPAVVLQSSEQSRVCSDELLSVGITNLKDSLFERLYRFYVHDPETRVVDMLCKQGRMNPAVALFPNKAFYGGLLEPVGLPHQMDVTFPYGARVQFIPSQSHTGGISDKCNIYEARLAADLAAQVYNRNPEKFDVTRTLGIITPYRSQIAMIKKELALREIPVLNEILVDTVERFQGSERDVIIYSFSVNYPWQLQFLSNVTEEDGVLIDRKLNVALTRARKQMYLIGVPELLKLNKIYEALIKLILPTLR
jgi:superfamily I DNA and/or RNA helicase